MTPLDYLNSLIDGQKFSDIPVQPSELDLLKKLMEDALVNDPNCDRCPIKEIEFPRRLNKIKEMYETRSSESSQDA